MLIIFAGLPGTGKTTIAKELTRQLGAVYLRIDSIEQAIRSSLSLSRSLDDAGYRVGYVMAEDNLCPGQTVITDSVNPLTLTRDAWIAVAKGAQVRTVEIEIICSDMEEHRNRVEQRITDIRGLKLPTWEEVASRKYQPWNRDHIVVDSANQTVNESVQTIQKAIDE